MTKENNKILVVDDDPKDLDLLLETLRNTDFHVITATNGNEALSKLKNQKPSLILLDIVMPEMNGYQFCQMLKSEQAYKDIPVVFFTCKNTDEDKQWGYDLGADDYIAKPYTREELFSVLKKFFPQAQKKAA